MHKEKKKPTSASAKKKRRRVNALLCVALALGAGAGAYAASRIIPAHGQWEYENRREYLELPELSLPCYVEISVWHEGQKPQGIEIANAGLRLNKIHEEPGTDGHTLTVWADIPEDGWPDADPGAWTLSLVPMDNLELTYKIDVRESYENARTDVRFLTDGDGHEWLYVDASYQWPREGEQLRVLAHLEGNGYLPTVLDWKLPENGGRILADVTQIAEERSLKTGSASLFSVTVMCGGTDKNGDPVAVNSKSNVRLAEWPPYKKSEWDGTDGAEDVTEIYLDAAIPNRKKPTEDNDAAGAEDAQEAGEGGGAP